MTSSDTPTAATRPASLYDDKPVADLLDFSGRVAIVTGAGSGIGAAIADRFAEAGARTIYASRDPNKASDRSKGSKNTLAIGGDLSHIDAVDSLFNRAQEAFGAPDILVNCAGIFPLGLFMSITQEDWRKVFAVNLDSAFYCSQRAAGLMAENGGGTIVNISSVAGSRGSPMGAAYGASKHAMEGLTKTLAIELGPMGIRAIGVAPGVTVTPGTTDTADAQREAGFDFESVGALAPLGRVATSDDIARVVLFAASPMAAYMTGSTLMVDGGLTARPL